MAPSARSHTFPPAAVWLATRDLRVHDNPALAAAAAAGAGGPGARAAAGTLGSPARVVPLFVLDPDLPKPPNRAAFLAAALADLDASLRARGAALVVRAGDPAEEAVRMALSAGARTVCVAADVSAHAAARQARLARLCAEARLELRVTEGATVLPPGALAPGDSDSDSPRAGGPAFYQVFTPYWRRWAATPARPLAAAPVALALPPAGEPGPLPGLYDLAGPGAVAASRLLPGGEKAAAARAKAWLAGPVAAYDATRDLLALDATSRLSPALHFGCISAVALAERLRGRPEAEPFLRQLCWRDFYAQLLAARPAIAREDFRPRPAAWIDDAEGLAAWQEGRTGYPVVDAAMRQLLAEGFVHNRARMIVASFLTKHLGIDWRLGARHYARHLVDGDVASNAGNWQWVAGTGADTKPHRVFNPTLQGQRYDPDGDYVRQWLPELAVVPGKAVHEPWKLPLAERIALDYPLPLVDHAEAIARYRARSSARVAE